MLSVLSQIDDFYMSQSSTVRSAAVYGVPEVACEKSWIEHDMHLERTMSSSVLQQADDAVILYVPCN